MGEKDKVFFNNHAQDWQVSKQNIRIAEEIIERLHIKPQEKIIDVGCGTGILYDLLTERDVMYYVGIDISEEMLKIFRERFPLATLVCEDFEGEISHIQGENDYCILFNVIPHFDNLLSVFKNASKLLKCGGRLVIVHSRTRAGLKAHHKAINFTSNKEEPIPLDEEFITLCQAAGFQIEALEDQNYFYLQCIKG